MCIRDSHLLVTIVVQDGTVVLKEVGNPELGTDLEVGTIPGVDIDPEVCTVLGVEIDPDVCIFLEVDPHTVNIVLKVDLQVENNYPEAAPQVVIDYLEVEGLEYFQTS